MIANCIEMPEGQMSNSEINGRYSELNDQEVERLESLQYMDLSVLDEL